jgi:hypothetical protein
VNGDALFRDRTKVGCWVGVLWGCGLLNPRNWLSREHACLRDEFCETRKCFNDALHEKVIY